jgi:hypothetical protein
MMTDANTLPAGRELDAEIASAVFKMEVCKNAKGGWSLGPANWWDFSGDMQLANPLPEYSSDIAMAWTVVEHLQTLSAQGDIHIECLEGMWSVSSCYESSWEKWSHADTAPLAICRAALAAVGGA